MEREINEYIGQIVGGLIFEAARLRAEIVELRRQMEDRDREAGPENDRT